MFIEELLKTLKEESKEKNDTIKRYIYTTDILGPRILIAIYNLVLK